MILSIPIHARSSSKKPFGVLVARIDLIPSLYDLLLDRTGMGKTGETLIVNNETIALNEGIVIYSQQSLERELQVDFNLK